MGSLIVDIIFFIVFLAVGFYALRGSNMSTPQGLVYLIVSIVFLIAAIIVGLSAAGIGLF